jgi:hypothetical protein
VVEKRLEELSKATIREAELWDWSLELRGEIAPRRGAKASVTPKPIRSLYPSPVDSRKLLDQLDRTKRNFSPRV